MRLQRLLYLCPVVLLFACSGETKKPLTLRERIGEKMKGQFNASGYSYGKKSDNIFASMFDYNFKFYLEDAKSPSDDYTLQDETAGLAVSLYHYLPDSIRSSYSEYEIHLKSAGQDYQSTFSSSDLEPASNVYEAVPSLLRWVSSDTTKPDMLDNRSFGDSARNAIREQFIDQVPGTGPVEFTVMKFESRDNSYSSYSYGHQNSYSSYSYSSYGSYDNDILFTVHVKRGTSEADMFIQVSGNNHLVNYVHTGPLDDED